MGNGKYSYLGHKGNKNVCDNKGSTCLSNLVNSEELPTLVFLRNNVCTEPGIWRVY